MEELLVSDICLSEVKITFSLSDTEILKNLYIYTQGLVYNILNAGDRVVTTLIHDDKKPKNFIFKPMVVKGKVGELTIKFTSSRLLGIFLQGLSNRANTLKFGNLLLLLTKYEIKQENPYTFYDCPKFVPIEFETPTLYRLKETDDYIRFPGVYEFVTSLYSKLAVDYIFLVSKIGFEKMISMIHIDRVVYGKTVFTSIFRKDRYDDNISGFVGKILYYIDADVAVRNIIYKLFKIGEFYGNGSRTSCGFGNYSIKLRGEKENV